MNLYKVTCSILVGTTSIKHEYIYVVSTNEGIASSLAKRKIIQKGWLESDFYVAGVELIATTTTDKPSLLIVGTDEAD